MYWKGYVLFKKMIFLKINKWVKAQIGGNNYGRS